MADRQEPRSNTTLEALGILAILVAMNYLIVRGVLLERAKYSVADGIFALLVLSAEAFILFHGIGYSIAILWSRKKAQRMAVISRDIPPPGKPEPPPVAIRERLRGSAAITYRNVPANATLASLADSELGSGTGYKALRLSWQRPVWKDLGLKVQLNHSDGYKGSGNKSQNSLLVDLGAKL